MQNALKNPHYKKIWEKVIMNRHPLCERKCNTNEAISLGLADALRQEMQFDGCYYYVGDNLNMVSRSIPTHKSIKYDKENGLYGLKILGRPITLFDVLKLLQKNIENGEFALMTNCVVLCNIDVTRNTSNDTFQYFVKKICDINNKSNLIEEQTPETWEKIAKLFF